MSTVDKLVKSIDVDTAKKLWIHCNCCYELFIKKKNIFFMLACQHVVCEKCVTATLGHTPVDAPVFMCPICLKRVRGRQVNNTLPTSLKDMFHPEPWIDGLPYDRVYKFRTENYKSLEGHIEKKEKETQKLYKDLQLAEKICTKHYMEFHRCRTERKQLDNRLQHIRQRRREIKRKEAQRRQRKSISPGANPSDIKPLNTGPALVASYGSLTLSSRPLPQFKSKASPQDEVITSFNHHNEHSFIL